MVTEPTRVATGRPAVAMVVRNPASNDARVVRAAEVLRDAGYDVTLVGLLRPGFGPEAEADGLHVVRVEPSGLGLRVIDLILKGPGRWAYRARKRHAWFVRRGRRIIARIRRQWWLLGERGTLVGVVGAWGASLRAPKAAAVSTLLFPAAVVRAVIRRTPVPPPDLAPREFPASRIVKVLNDLDRVNRKLLIEPRAAMYAWTFQRRAARAMAAVRPVVYHCHDIHTLWAGFLASRIHRAPVVYDAHEIYAHQSGRPRTLRRRMFVSTVEWIALRRCAGSISVNDSLADWYAQQYRVPRPTVVRNIPALAVSSGDDVEIPEPFLLPETKLLYLGRITNGRGIETCVQALAFLPDARLLLMGPVGRPTVVQALEQIASDVGVLDRVHIIPPVPHAQVTRIAAHATIGLALGHNMSLSYYLALPNKVFECMHAGLPIVVSNFPEMERIVKECDIGAACDPEDPRAIAEAIRGLLADPANLERLRANVARAATLYTWEREAERLRGLYVDLASIG